MCGYEQTAPQNEFHTIRRRAVRTCSSTYKRIAEERLLCWRFSSIWLTNFDSVSCWLSAISFRSFQNASSRLMLVLCPPMMTERLAIEDFISAPLAPSPSIIIQRFGTRQSSLTRAEASSFFGYGNSSLVQERISGSNVGLTT